MSSTRISVWIFLALAFCSASNSQSVWSWKCLEGNCIKVAVRELNTAAGEKVLGKNACKITCAPQNLLWPKPTGSVEISPELTYVNPNSIYYQSAPGLALPPQTKALLYELGQIFIQNVFANLKGKQPITYGGHNMVVTVSVAHPNITTFTQDVDESYELTINEDGNALAAHIRAPTYLGARHGTETLSQLILFDDAREGLVIPSSVSIRDKPAYVYRGLLLDTARSYFSVAAIKRTLDAMAASKLNTFHWHITDSQSFPMVLSSYPQMTQYGAYSPQKIYSHDDIRGIVNYAKARGIRVVPEFDAPAHVGEGWAHLVPEGNREELVVCFKAEPWREFCVEPPCGQLNPTSEKVYQILSAIYSDMNNLFQSDLFHMGGDEVNINCWNSTSYITDWMHENNINTTEDGFHDLWDYFQRKALDKLEAINGKSQKIILWTSSFTTENRLNRYLDKNKYIIQIWTTGQDQTIANLVKSGFPVIFSNYDALYMDCGFGAWIGEGNNWCSPYIGWQKIYENDPIKMLAALGVDASSGTEARKLVLGQEATLWSEQADDYNLDNRLWPRVAAMAERLWSNPTEGWKAAEKRMLHHRERLTSRGFVADLIEPEWCYQNEGFCY